MLSHSERCFLLSLLVFSLCKSSVVGECLSTKDCSAWLGGTVTCQSGVCQQCPYLLYSGLYLNQSRLADFCSVVCSSPGTSAADDFCNEVLQRTDAHCFAVTDPKYSGYTTTTPVFMLPNGLMYYLGGICATCSSGNINAAGTTCVTDSPPPDSPPPDSPPPTPPNSPPPTGTPLGGTQGTPPTNTGNSPSGTAPAPKPEKSMVPGWAKGVAISAAGAVVAGIIGLFFYCFQSRHALAVNRQRYPLAETIRKELQLKKVNDFESNPGLQFRTSVQTLADAIAARKVLRSPSLLGQSTPALGTAMSEVLNGRYPRSITLREKAFLGLFAKDCGTEASLAGLAAEVEAKVASKPGWAEQLLLPPSVAAAPQAPPPHSAFPANTAKPSAPYLD